MSGQARVGFVGEAALRPWGGRYWQFAIEFWLPTLLFAILPVLYFVRSMLLSRRMRRRADMRLCPRCGYDLRATPGRCPECGAVPEKEEA